MAQEQEENTLTLPIGTMDVNEYMYDLHNAIGEIKKVIFGQKKLDLDQTELYPLSVLTDLQLKLADKLFNQKQG